MGAVFRTQPVRMTRQQAIAACRDAGIPLLATAMSADAVDLRQAELPSAAVIIGSEGQGICRELFDAAQGKIIIPMLPFYIAATFCNLSYEGMITHQLPAFIQIILIVMAGHYIWLAVLYLLAGAYSGKNPWEVLRHYGPAYLTAVGTMSSAATLAVALDCARKSKVLRKDMVSFGIPLFANIHLCGSVLTEVFFCMTISKILYGHLPSIGTMLLFCALLGIFAIGAPGVPGGTVMASLGLITGVLMFDDAGTALMLAIFALQDSFGTACNVTGDGALTLMLTGYAEKHGIKNNDNIQSPVL